MIRARTASFLVCVLLLASVAHAGEGTGDDYARLMERTDLLLGKRRPGADSESLRAAAARLAAIPRSELTDGEWIDLHVVLAEVERRLNPMPRLSGPGLPPKAYLAAVPDRESLADVDTLSLLDMASTLRRTKSPPGSFAASSKDYAKLRQAGRRARTLAILAAYESLKAEDDAVRTAALEVLAEAATDFAFDLRCRAENLFTSGADRFRWALSMRHRVGVDLDRARAIGEEELRRTGRALEALAAEIGEGGDWRELTEAARDDHSRDSTDYLKSCREATEQAAALARDSGRVTVPDHAMHLDVVLGRSSRRIPYAQYLRGRMDGAGRFRATAQYTDLPSRIRSDPRAARRWFRERDHHWMKVVCAHEGVPGHHLQFAVASQVESRYRRFGYNSLYVEGWGLYSEELMERSGWYSDPLDRLAWLRMKRWRAARVVIDVGIHTGRMRPSAAVRLLTDEVLLERASAEQEVMRYLSMPTQALSYMLGHRRIVAMRKAWIAVHGEDREREFHDRLLGLGVVPLDLAAAVLLGRREAYDRAHPWSFEGEGG